MIPARAARAVMLGVSLCFSACADLPPRYRQPVVGSGTAAGKAYSLPPCRDSDLAAGTQRMPCRTPVARPEVSACEKRFGKICRSGERQ